MKPPKKIGKIEDLDSLRDGEFYFIDIPGLPDDPEELLTHPGWAKLRELEAEVIVRFKNGLLKTKNGD